MKQQSKERLGKIKDHMKKCLTAITEEIENGNVEERFLLKQASHLLGGSIEILEEELF